MNKIDELQAKISACYRNRQELVKALDNEVQKYEKEIAALEAQAKGPREFVLGLDDAGNMVSLSKYGTGIHYKIHGMYENAKKYIPLIEKNKVKVTREMAVTMHMATVYMTDDIGLVPRAVATLRAAGIEAEPSND